MKARILRSGMNVRGWRDLPEIGTVVDVPETLAPQLIAQRIIEPVKDAPQEPAAEAEGEASPADAAARRRARAESKGD